MDFFSIDPERPGFADRSFGVVTCSGVLHHLETERAAQHSQALHSWFMHVPGLKVVMPSTPRDAKGLLLSCITDDDPVVYIDDRWLYDQAGEVPEEPCPVALGSAAIRREGQSVTVAASSYTGVEGCQGCVAS